MRDIRLGLDEIHLRTDWDVLGFSGFHHGMTIWFVWALSIAIDMVDTDCYGLFMIVIVENWISSLRVTAL